MNFTLRCMGATLVLVSGHALAQVANPTLRSASPHVRFSEQARLPEAVVESVVTAGTPFSSNCGDSNGTVYFGAEVEPHVAVNPLNPKNLVGAWQQDRYSNGGSRGQAYGASFDGGLTWTRSALPVSVCAGGLYERATDPWIAFGPDGTAHQVTLAFGGQEGTPTSVSAIIASRSTDGGITWSTPIVITQDTGIFFNDKETITADPFDARFVYAIWDRLLGGNSSGTVFSRSTDAGVTWEPSRVLYVPSGGQTIGNVIRVLPNGTLVNAFMQVTAAASRIHVMRSTDRGANWSAPILVSDAPARGTTDPDTGVAVRDGAIVPQMAVAPNGTLYIVWQDMRFAQQRDAIAMSRSTDGGLTWSAPVRINSDPNVPAFTPQVHVREDGTIGITYYDFRSNTADPATLLTDFWLARSADGVNWSETRVSAPFDLSKAPFVGAYFLGDYTGLASSGTTFIAFYAKTTGDPSNRNDVYSTRIGPATNKATHAAAPLPAWEIDDASRAAALANARRALETRYLKVQR
ncbi:MAG TPA: sialidase family protein [Usitatibacter sp.]|nr:sialidase family protein [Usitatibacter sp.]